MNEITAYCLCVLCCGPDSSLTASGRPPVIGVSIAAPRTVPFGTWVEVKVPGQPILRRRVDDRTHWRWGWRYDVLVEDHLVAKRFGLRRGVVRVISLPVKVKTATTRP